MHRTRGLRLRASYGLLAAIAVAPFPTLAQSGFDGAMGAATATSSSDDRASASARRAAERASGLRVIVSLEERMLWVMSQQDTLMEAPVAIGTGGRITHLRRSWTFDTPRGVRTVLRKKVDPVWTPPDWAYVEVAQEHGLELEHLSARRPRTLSDGRRLAVRGDLVYLDDVDGSTQAMNLDEHIVFDDILFVPPTSTRNRRIEGELGRYALDTGNGYMLHGTPYTDTIGQKASHGCLRLRDEDIAWLYDNVPVGTKVYLF